MQRLVPGTAAPDPRPLAALQLSAADEFVVGAEQDDVGVGGREAVQALDQHPLRVIDELLHGVPRDSYSSSLKRARRRAISAMVSSSTRLRRASPRSGTVSVSFRAPAGFLTRSSRRGCASAYAARNSRRSAAVKWQISKIVSRCCTGIGPAYTALAICEMNERFFPNAIARRWRVPDGRVSSTRFSTPLYAPTLFARSRSGFMPAMARISQ